MFSEKIKTIKYENSFKSENYYKIAQFNCGNDDINSLFRKKLDKLHTTTYLFMDNNTNKIISFVSFCASAIQIKDKRGLLSLPAVELKLFGVDKEYQHKKLILNEIELKYSEFVFQWLIGYIQNVVKPVVNIEYLILHSVPSENTLKFYEKMGMQYLSQNQNVHSSDFSNGCIPMYLEI